MSTTALKTPAQHSTIWDSLSDKSKARRLVATSEDFDKLSERVVSQWNRVDQIIPRNKLLALIAVVVLAHIIGLTGFINALHQPSIVKPKKTEVIVEFIKPEVIPPPVIEPPKPPPPKVQRANPPPQAAKPAALRTAPADQHIAPSDIVVQENTTAAKTSGPVVAEPTPEPAPPPPVIKEEPLVEAKGGVGHLNNPSPEYPDFAADQGLEGTVVLRVKVLPNGKPGEVKVKKSSGHGILDDAAVTAAKRWAFTPAKRGNTPVEGWAIFPVEFKLQ